MNHSISKIQQSNKHNVGFTLIEIIVSLAIFSIVAVIAIGALVRVTSANRQAQAIQSGVNNVSFVLDAISREVRVAEIFSCSLSAPASPSSITSGLCEYNSQTSDVYLSYVSSYTDQNGNYYAYSYHFYSSGGVVKISKAEGLTGGSFSEYYPLVSNSVNITDYTLKLKNGSYNSSSPYAWVFIDLKGYVGKVIKDQSVFNVQMSASQAIAEP